MPPLPLDYLKGQSRNQGGQSRNRGGQSGDRDDKSRICNDGAWIFRISKYGAKDPLDGYGIKTTTLKGWGDVIKDYLSGQTNS